MKSSLANVCWSNEADYIGGRLKRVFESENDLANAPLAMKLSLFMDPACGLCEYDFKNPASTSNVKNFDRVMHRPTIRPGLAGTVPV